MNANPLPRAWLAALLAAPPAAAALGWAVSAGPVAMDPSLAVLLRFMAVIKAAMALAAAALVVWRVRQGASATAIVAAGVTLCLMGVGAGMIWSLRAGVLGALCFHAGLIGLCVLAWREHRTSLSPRPAPQRLPTGTAASFLRRNGIVQGGS